MIYFVYSLCSLTSLGCAGLLMRAYFRNKTRLLFWSSFCFITFALNNILLTLDYALGPEHDLSTIRASLGFLGTGVMLYGLIWDTV